VLVKRNATIFNVIHRIHNPNIGSLEKFALPFLITVPSWFTLRELSALIYVEAKRFIDFEYFKKKIT
jgi:hypothetical protein